MFLGACALCLALCGAVPQGAAADAKPVPAPFVIEPPPGWSLAESAEKNPSLVLALKGPEKSSFVLARIAPVSLENRAAVRTLLTGVLSNVGERASLKFKLASNLEAATYGNGLTVYFIRANLDEKPRLALAVMEMGGVYMLGTLVSAVPDTLLPSILGSLRPTGVPVDGDSPSVTSLDGQLTFLLPPGVRSRVLSQRERQTGYVAGFEASGAEFLVMKLDDDGTPVKKQPDIVKSTVLSIEGIDPKSLTPLGAILTSAGPDFIYAWARFADASGENLFLACYMPWGYWGYSITARGAKAPELATKLLGNLSLGPSASPKLVAASPRLPVSAGLDFLSPWTSTLILALLLAVAAWFWWRNRGL